MGKGQTKRGRGCTAVSGGALGTEAHLWLHRADRRRLRRHPGRRTAHQHGARRGEQQGEHCASSGSGCRRSCERRSRERDGIPRGRVKRTPGSKILAEICEQLAFARCLPQGAPSAPTAALPRNGKRRARGAAAERVRPHSSLQHLPIRTARGPTPSPPPMRTVRRELNQRLDEQKERLVNARRRSRA